MPLANIALYCSKAERRVPGWVVGGWCKPIFVSNPQPSYFGLLLGWVAVAWLGFGVMTMNWQQCLNNQESILVKLVPIGLWWTKLVQIIDLYWSTSRLFISKKMNAMIWTIMVLLQVQFVWACKRTNFAFFLQVQYYIDGPNWSKISIVTVHILSNSKIINEWS